MHDLITDVDRERAAILADALSDTVAELRLIDPGDLIGHIRAGQWAAIADLVQSASDLTLREGCLIFSCSADFKLDWATTPLIALEMELQVEAISAFFTLYLDRGDGMVAMRHVRFPVDPASPQEGTAALAQAVAEARLHYGSAMLPANRRR